MRNLKHASAFLEQGQNKVFPDSLIYHWSLYSIKAGSIRKNYMNAGQDSLWIDRICITETRSGLGKSSGNSSTRKRCPRNLLVFLGCLPAKNLSVPSFMDKGYIYSPVTEPHKSIPVELSVQNTVAADLPSSGSQRPLEWVRILNLTHNRWRKENIRLHLYGVSSCDTGGKPFARVDVDCKSAVTARW